MCGRRADRLDDAKAALRSVAAGPLAELYRDDVAEFDARIAAAKRDEKGLTAAVAVFVRDFSWVDTKRLARVRALTANPAPAPGPEAPSVPDDAPRPNDDD